MRGKTSTLEGQAAVGDPRGHVGCSAAAPGACSMQGRHEREHRQALLLLLKYDVGC